VEIKIGGFGGQGVILAGHIVGRAAAIFDDKEATFTRSFGPEARGSACSAQVIISDERIAYPYVTHPEIMILMSQEAYQRYYPELSSSGTLIIENDLVHVGTLKSKQRLFGIPATRLAEEMGRRIVTNLVMVGFFTAVTKAVGHEAMREAIKQSVPKGTEDLNLLAFQRGYDFGVQELERAEANNG
jgi:2-oxoglutarate ferredoxin oxidoreductase subunit gamma